MDPPGEGKRIAYIDGLRGLTALAIVLTHIYWEVCPRGDGGDLPLWLAAVLRPLAFSGKVSVFVALSGYCLTRSELRSGASSESIGNKLRSFFRRRAARLLPAYYAALAGSLALAVIVPFLRTPCGARWDMALPALSADALLPHLLLIHNLSPAWISRIDPPLWSMAVEAQLSVLFALLLFPLYRQAGRLALLVGGGILGFLPLLALPSGRNLFWTCPWLLPIFCFGMVAAAGGDPALRHRSRLVTACLTLPMLALMLSGNVYRAAHPVRSDLLTGLFVACLLVDPPRGVVRALETRPALWLGRISYSLYLVHFPLVALCHGAIRGALPSLSSPMRLALLLLIAVPLSLGAAQAFYEGVERRGIH